MHGNQLNSLKSLYKHGVSLKTCLQAIQDIYTTKVPPDDTVVIERVSDMGTQMHDFCAWTVTYDALEEKGDEQG